MARCSDLQTHPPPIIDRQAAVDDTGINLAALPEDSEALHVALIKGWPTLSA